MRPLRSAIGTVLAAGLVLAGGAAGLRAGDGARPATEDEGDRPLDETPIAEIADDVPVGEAIARVLRESRRADPVPPEELSPKVSQHGPAALEPVLDMLVSRRVLETPEEPTPQTLSTPQREILLDALRALRPNVVLAAASDRAQSDGLAGRIAAVYVHGALGSSRQLGGVLEWCAPGEEELDPRLDQAFQWALTELVRRDTETVDELARLRRTVDTGLNTSIVLALGGAGDARALRVLGEIVHWHPELLVPAAAQIVKLGPSGDPEIDRELVGVLVEALDPNDDRGAPAIALALGALGDPEPVPELVELLDASHGAVRENALIALRELTGLGLHGSAALWRRWLVTEEAWYAREAEATFRQLLSPSDVEVCTAVRTLARHPLRRHEIALRLAPLVESPKAIRRGAAVKALGVLRSTRGIESLVLALDDHDEGIRAQAHLALRATTGLDHPPEADAWRELLRDRG